MTPEDPEAAKMLAELRQRAADRPAHARRLARLETVAGVATRSGWHPDTIYAALHRVQPTEGCSERVAEALLTDLRWIVGSGGDREKGYVYPDAYGRRRAADAGRKRVQFREPGA